MSDRVRTLGAIVADLVRVNVSCWRWCDIAAAGRTDAEVATAQREINGYNAERNRLIEEFDSALAHYRDRVPE